jgi:hypothetical protein
VQESSICYLNKIIIYSGQKRPLKVGKGFIPCWKFLNSPQEAQLWTPTGMTRPGSKMTVVLVLTRAMSSGPPYFSWVYCLILAAGTLDRPKRVNFRLFSLSFFKYKERITTLPHLTHYHAVHKINVNAYRVPIIISSVL